MPTPPDTGREPNVRLYPPAEVLRELRASADTIADPAVTVAPAPTVAVAADRDLPMARSMFTTIGETVVTLTSRTVFARALSWNAPLADTVAPGSTLAVAV